MIYYIKEQQNGSRNAGGKAPADIEEICSRMEFLSLSFPYKINADKGCVKKCKVAVEALSAWLDTVCKMKKEDILIFQYPMCFMPLAWCFIPLLKKKKINIIAVIHDLNYIRYQGQCGRIRLFFYKHFDEILRNVDRIICHNDKMKQLLEDSGYRKEQLISLRIFDYLCEKKRDTFTECRNTVAIAGNLTPTKSGYIYKLLRKKRNYHIHLYGSNLVDGKYENMIYQGSYEASELPLFMKEDFGLVWDGKEIEGCEGNLGNYLKINNPHKLSLYLASAMPVLIWKEAAMADFVLENQIGFAIESLEEIEGIFKHLTKEEYSKMRQNASVIGDRLRQGFYFTQALNKCLDSLGREQM